MAGINKNFVVKNGLEVNSNLIYADADNNRVGINTNDVMYALHVNGGIGATSIYSSGISTFGNIHLSGDVIAGNAGVGSTGQYLVRTGTGVTWQNLPTARTSETVTATVGQTVFLFSYTIGLLDVFINGVKLSTSEYTADDGASIILNNACFGSETVEFISYSSVNPGYAFTGIYGISLFEEGSPVGTTGQVVTLNFVGTAVTATATGTGATVYINDSVNPNYWEQTSVGINTLSNVGLGTTNPRFALEVGAVGASGTSLWVNGNARVTGILTVGSSSIVLDGSTNTINVGSGITINGNTGIISASNFYASGIEVGVITATTIVYQNGTTLTQDWTRTASGIHTLASVGIGTTNPTSALTVKGNTSLETLNVNGYTEFNQLRVSGVSTFGRLQIGISTVYSVSDSLGNIGIGTNAAIDEYSVGNSVLSIHGRTWPGNPTVAGSGVLRIYSNSTLLGQIYGNDLTGVGYGKNFVIDSAVPMVLSCGSTIYMGQTTEIQQLKVTGISTLGVTTSTSLFTNQLSVSGVTTSVGGFTSGIGVTDPVQITVSGNVLTFTVVGVGSTSLTLY